MAHPATFTLIPLPHQNNLVVAALAASAALLPLTVGAQAPSKKARTFILGHLKPCRDEFTFRTLDEYRSYIRTMELRALSGDLVKSFAELDIANFLFVNGVNFEYEKRYPYGRDRYQPDFYLTDYKIWLEHFGIDRRGNTAPYIDRDKYRHEMEWKRSVHAKNNTTLLETYSWQKSEGILTRTFNELLKGLLPIEWVIFLEFWT